MLKEVPIFTTDDFNKITTETEGDFIAFVYDSNNEPVGVVMGTDVTIMLNQLRATQKLVNNRYVLFQVIENNIGQTFH